MVSSMEFAGDGMHALLEYCSVACNSTPGCLCWSYPGVETRGDYERATVLYGACNSLIEYDFEVNFLITLANSLQPQYVSYTPRERICIRS